MGKVGKADGLAVRVFVTVAGTGVGEGALVNEGTGVSEEIRADEGEAAIIFVGCAAGAAQAQRINAIIA
jgi:hypothetical protein